jgi:D-psicose/D-tagatose/L-ribulose 3-epimerase
MIQYGINTFLWSSPFQTKDLHYLDHAKALGFDLVEIPIESAGDLDYEAAAEVYARNGLACTTCAVMGAGRDPSHPDEKIQQAGIAYLKHCIDGTAAMGGSMVVGPLYAAVGRQWQATPAQRKADLALAARNLRVAADYAEKKGIRLALEPLNRFETSFINLATQAIEVIDRVNHANCQIMLDTFHMNIEEKSLGNAIRAAGPRLKHLHACENDRGAPGSGNVQWDDVRQGLKDIGYDGPIVIESFTAKVKSIARAAAIWRALAPTQDDLAREGVVFLKKLLT